MLKNEYDIHIYIIIMNLNIWEGRLYLGGRLLLRLPKLQFNMLINRIYSFYKNGCGVPTQGKGVSLYYLYNFVRIYQFL